MRNIRLTLAYDGTQYVGWQVQPNGSSVQQMLEQAIHAVTGEELRVMAAGRTDTGVHALGQVVNFHTNSTIPCEGIRAALQANLPDDIIVRKAADVDESFHATHSAKKKHYRYVIHTGPPQHPFLRTHVCQRLGRLDAAAMHEAAQVLVGTHDFRSFESHFPNKATSVRTVFEAGVTRQFEWPAWQNNGTMKRGAQSEEPAFLWFDIVADGFLYNMVRAIVGTLIKVGEGKWTTEDVRRVLESLDRSNAGPTAPPQGLYLVDVDYGGGNPTGGDA